MIIIDKNEGAKVVQGLTGTFISFRDGELSLDLARFERDFDVTVVITENEFGMLQMGLARRYVAEIQIPARIYDEVDTGQKDENGQAIMEMVAQPFDIKKVTLTLWAVN